MLQEEGDQYERLERKNRELSAIVEATNAKLQRIEGKYSELVANLKDFD
jgi:hypothetical protein